MPASDLEIQAIQERPQAHIDAVQPDYFPDEYSVIDTPDGHSFPKVPHENLWLVDAATLKCVDGGVCTNIARPLFITAPKLV